MTTAPAHLYLPGQALYWATDKGAVRPVTFLRYAEYATPREGRAFPDYERAYVRYRTTKTDYGEVKVLCSRLSAI